MVTLDKPVKGRPGGLKGGPARAKKLSPSRRAEIASMGGIAAKKARTERLLTKEKEGSTLEYSK